MTTETNSCVQLQADDQGVLTVWLDTPGRSVNVFDAAMIVGLEHALDTIEAQIVATPPTKLVVFRSRKAGCFFAGADVHAIANMHHQEAVAAVVGRGQQLMQRLSDLPIPTLALIDGICMGGGLEFALACRYRVATDGSKTKLSVPEIRLGLIPGWGGTQRLPKLVGLQQSLKMILKGSSLNSAKALHVGLVDRVLDHQKITSQLGAVIAEITAGEFHHSTPRASWLTRVLEGSSLGRRWVLAMARRTVAAQIRHYPALGQAIASVGMAFLPNRDGFQFEREAFTQLLFTPTAQSLLGLFVQRDRAKKIGTWVDVSKCNPTAERLTSSHIDPAEDALVTHAPLGRLAIIGAGQMGAGIGTLAAQQGIDVTFKEIDEATSKAGSERMADLLKKQVSAGRLSERECQLARDRCHFTSRWEDLNECGMAIEAVLEVESVKRDVFQHMDRSLPPSALLVSNTSSLNVTRLAMATTRHHKVAGLHFFHPVDRMELVEVVRTEMTDEATVATLLELVRRLGKTPIVTSDKPGFLVNRVLFPYLGEAVRMVAEGFDIANIDAELKRFGMPMGPLELIDQVGIDIASHVANSLASVQADAEIPAAFLGDMAQRKWLGKKAKIGFYQWNKQRRPNSKLKQTTVPIQPTGVYEADGLTPISRRLVYPMLNEAVHCLDELVVTEPWMVDLGMVLGTGFAPMHGGPLRLIDSIGVGVVCRNMGTLERNYGKRFSPADGLAAHAARQQPFYHVSNLNPPNWESNHEPRCTTES
ncbi:MAG: 3-hydroxyacyl-CoA dehydrogenase NAD-binding domain-containing protein [Aureliella sp.]